MADVKPNECLYSPLRTALRRPIGGRQPRGATAPIGRERDESLSSFLLSTDYVRHMRMREEHPLKKLPLSYNQEEGGIV